MQEEAWEAEEDDDWDDEDGLCAPCPYCGAEMLEDSPRCPECGRYISDEDRPPERKPPWIVVGVVVCVIIVLAWMAG